MTGPEHFILDTNVLLRFLMNDHAEQSAAAAALIGRASKSDVVLEIPMTVILETVWTLGSFFKLPRHSISSAILTVLSSPGIKLRAPSWVMDAVADFGKLKTSFGDACIAAEAKASGLAIASFDQDFDSFPGVRRYQPNIVEV